MDLEMKGPYRVNNLSPQREKFFKKKPKPAPKPPTKLGISQNHRMVGIRREVWG